MLIRITAPHFCAGLTLGGKQCAPIIHYMRNWNLNRITDYCRSKGWAIEVTPEPVTEADRRFGQPHYGHKE